jgi:hypothetical protein
MMTRMLLSLAIAAALAGTAAAQSTVTSRPYSGYNQIAQGVNELGLDSLLIFDWASEGDEDPALRMSMLGGLAGRRFIRPNLAVGITARGFYRSSGGPDRDAGGLVGLEIARYLRLGEGVFLAPTLGGGVLFGTRRTPIDDAMTLDSSLLGGAVSVGLPLVLYAWEKFNVRAGPSFVFSLGKATAQGVSTSSSHLDGGFSVGAAYYF